MGNASHQITKGCDTIDIVSWTATQIIVKVPSRISSGYYQKGQKGIAGSGPIRIVNSTRTDSVTSNTSISIRYSLFNDVQADVQGGQARAKQRTYLLNQSCLPGLVFTLHTSLQGASTDKVEARAAIAAGLKQWQDSTGISLSLEKDGAGNLVYSNVAGLPYDGKNIISFRPGSPGGTLMAVVPDFGTEITGTKEYRKTASIIIGDTTAWHYSITTPLPAGKFDFMKAFLHEIGHVLGLDHAYTRIHDGPPLPISEVEELMYCQSNTNQTDQPVANRLLNLDSYVADNAVHGAIKNVSDSKKQKWLYNNPNGHTESTLFSSCIAPPKIKLCVADTIISVQNIKVGNTYQWQISLDDGTSYAVPLATQIGNATTVNATLKKGFIKNGAKIRCVVTNGALKDTTLYTIIYTNGLPTLKQLPSIARNTVKYFDLLPYGYPEGG